MTRSKSRGRQTGWLAAGLLCSLGASVALAAPVVELRTAQQSNALGKYAPEAEAMPGLCMEILRAVEHVDPGLRFTGLKLRAPLRRIERLLAQEELDAFFCLLKTPEREQQWRYLPVPLFRIRHMILQRADDATDYRSVEDLAASRKPVLVMQGTSLQEVLTRARVPTDAPPSEREAMKMLLAGRTDAIYGQDINLLRNLRESGLEGQLRVATTVFREEPQYLVVSRSVPAAVEQRLVQALQTLERNGTLKALAARYR
ncbi:ABC transporter substrate-binding protein [Pelomonas sp. KK5]|uniref:substrate-binding periplasmic protein n=1 Tax=Pelomonas sp. KK5 TaxID=1855730 RepID=UPI0009F97323|nr:transporter substrate-binding domain-containing protein [Pelomonas sp. KK5]